MSNTMTLNLLIWRQPNPEVPGKMVPYVARDVAPEMSFLEMLDALNEVLTLDGEEPI